MFAHCCKSDEREVSSVSACFFDGRLLSDIVAGVRECANGMNSRLCAAISVVALIGVSSALSGQKAKAPTLDEILGRLEANLNHYDKDLPSLFCDEHAVSAIEPGGPDQNTVTDSLFRLKRTAGPEHTSSLVESREIKSVNGKPAKTQDMEGPSLLSGAFEGGLAVVSVDQKVCMKYTLQRVKRNEPYVVRFATAITPENSAACLLQEKSDGRALIDPASMQITHLELITPHHVIVHGSPYASPVIGKRTLTVDYAPMVLGGQTFWLPSAISQRSIGDANTFHATVWTYKANYRNCHRLEVTSRILPGTPTR